MSVGARSSGARAQAGLSLSVLGRAGEARNRGRARPLADDGFLVLARPASNQPSVRAGEDLEYQARRAREMFARLRPLSATEGLGAVTLETVRDAPKHYGDACLSFCELADRCREEALQAGLPNALGEDLARYLGDVTLHRALQLLHGTTPSNDAERDFLRRAR